MNSTQLSAIERHGRNLLTIFPNAIERDPVKLCKKLRRLEAIGNRIGLLLCNDSTYSIDRADEDGAIVMQKVDKLLGNDTGTTDRVPVFLNRDPRGYALKISSDWLNKQRSDHRTVHKAIIKRDLGGYGLIAPEIKG